MSRRPSFTSQSSFTSRSSKTTSTKPHSTGRGAPWRVWATAAISVALYLAFSTFLTGCYGPSRVAKRPVHRELFLADDVQSVWLGINAMPRLTIPAQATDYLNVGYRLGIGHRLEVSLAMRGGGLSYTFGPAGGRQLQLGGDLGWTAFVSDTVALTIIPTARATLRQPVSANVATLFTVAAQTSVLANNGQHVTTLRTAMAWLWGPWDWLGLALNVAALRVQAYTAVGGRPTLPPADRFDDQIGWSIVIGGLGYHNNSAAPVSIRLHDKVDVLALPELRWRSDLARWEWAMVLGLRYRWSYEERDE